MLVRKYQPLSPLRRRVLRALAEGHTVSKLTATHQRIGNINDVVMHLRRRGWNIATVRERDINGDMYTKYELDEHQRAPARHAALTASGS